MSLTKIIDDFITEWDPKTGEPEAFRAGVAKLLKSVLPGATGDFPDGSMGEHDEGGLRIATTADHRKGAVMIHFGKQISFLGLPPKEADDFANSIQKYAAEIRRRSH